ncbi:MAG: hypothetical protein N4A44_00760 [Alphaproteobacteria bacterium]|nr:hypothetical protein [Alphaproteobacteria bacterium]
MPGINEAWLNWIDKNPFGEDAKSYLMKLFSSFEKKKFDFKDKEFNVLISEFSSIAKFFKDRGSLDKELSTDNCKSLLISYNGEVFIFGLVFISRKENPRDEEVKAEIISPDEILKFNSFSLKAFYVDFNVSRCDFLEKDINFSEMISAGKQGYSNYYEEKPTIDFIDDLLTDEDRKAKKAENLFRIVCTSKKFNLHQFGLNFGDGIFETGGKESSFIRILPVSNKKPEKNAERVILTE